MRYWGECIFTDTHLINRLPTQPLHNKTSYELWYHKQPTYYHLKSFGCLCFPTLLMTHKDTFEPRTMPHIFIGYPFNTKGYKVLNFATKKVHKSRDVVFHEKVFPFFLAPDGSSFNSILKLLVHSTNSTCVPGTINTYVYDDLLNNATSEKVTNNFITTNTHEHTSSPAAPTEHASAENTTNPSIVTNDAEPVPRRTTRTIHTPKYLHDCTYRLPNYILPHL